MYDTLGRGLPKGHAAELGRRLSAQHLPGHRAQRPGRADRQPVPPRRHDRRSSSGPSSICCAGSTSRHQQQIAGEADLAARIESFELAYRMQMAAPEALDLDQRAGRTSASCTALDNPQVHALRQAVPDRPAAGRARRALRADLLRRHGERAELGRPHEHRRQPPPVRRRDRQPIAGLLTDLEAARPARIDAGRSGAASSAACRSCRKGGTGRDHNPHAFTTWLAGGGVKGGVHHGATDEIGHKAVEDRVSVNDLHATILHLLGIDHEKLTYRYNGRDFRLTDVAGNVVRSVLA